MSQGERRLAAIMFTDIVGFTALGQRNESLSLALLDEHRKLLRPVLSRHNGKEIKTMGDGSLVEFANALDAVRCAYDLQRVSREFNAPLPLENRLLLKVGVHLGDIVVWDGDIFGDAVNVASRIAPIAEEGGVCLTQQVRDQVVNKFELPLALIGPKTLKNVSEPLDVYRMVMPWEPAVGVSGALDKHRVAVMPLVNMISDPSEEYFADGMTEELISAVSKVHGLSVISRTSVMHYKNQSRMAGEIGRELKVGTLLEGSVRKAGNRVRIAVQLIDAKSDEHLWAESYDRTLDDVFAIQSEIAKSIASVLKVRLLENDRKQLNRLPTRDPEAHALYLKARSSAVRNTMKGLKEAVELYQDAIARDGRFALAYAWLGFAVSMMGFFDMAAPVESFRRSEELARRSIELDPSLSEAHAALGFALQGQWNFTAAAAEMDRALELGPSSEVALSSKAALMMFMSRFDESESLARRALELDPLGPTTISNCATFLLYSGHPDEAVELYRKVLKIDPDSAFARCNMGVAYVREGMVEEGISQIREAIKMAGIFSQGMTSDLAYALGTAGKKTEIEALLNEALEWHGKNQRGATAIVSLYSNLGDKDKALEWLERAFAERSGYLPSVACDYAFEKLRSDPRALKVIDRLGLQQRPSEGSVN